jgi:hypothetical protein
MLGGRSEIELVAYSDKIHLFGAGSRLASYLGGSQPTQETVYDAEKD